MRCNLTDERVELGGFLALCAHMLANHVDEPGARKTLGLLEHGPALTHALLDALTVEHVAARGKLPIAYKGKEQVA